MEYKKHLKEQRERLLKEKFSPKTYSQNWEGLRALILPSAYLIQILTAALAVAVPAYCVKVLSGSWALGFALGGVILLTFEAVKRLLVNNTALSYFKTKRLSFAGVLSVIIVVGLSVASSGFGTPILVREFSPGPPPVKEAEIVARFDSLRAAAGVYWLDVKKEALSKAAEVHKQNNWRGVTVKAARSTKLGLERQAAAARDSLSSSLSSIALQEAEALSKAEAAFLLAAEKREAEKALIGAGLALFTLFLELCFLLCYTWLNYYDYRQAIEEGLLTFKSYHKAPEIVGKVPQSKEQSKAKEEPAQRGGIGFNQEGRIIKEGDKLLILCKTRRGLKAYDSSYLSTLLNEAERKGQPRAEYWREQRAKLQAAKA